VFLLLRKILGEDGRGPTAIRPHCCAVVTTWARNEEVQLGPRKELTVRRLRGRPVRFSAFHVRTKATELQRQLLTVITTVGSIIVYALGLWPAKVTHRVRFKKINARINNVNPNI
jgi:hypothetical protein